MTHPVEGLKIGDTCVRNGRVWRLYEIELEGEKWEDLGPVSTKPQGGDQGALQAQAPSVTTEQTEGAVVAGWKDISTAPKDGTHIVGWCVHNADEYHLKDGFLTTYAAHVEGLGHVGDGAHVLEWGGEYDHDGEGYIPDWWFRVGSDFEEAANPTHWMPLPNPPAIAKGGTS